MKKIIIWFATILIIFVTTSFISNSHSKLIFTVEFNKEIYSNSLWGDSPQFAMWLVNNEKQKIINVCVTHRTAENDWIGKASCPVSLPIWSLHNKKFELQRKAYLDGKIKVDAVTGASIKVTNLLRSIFTNENNYDFSLDGVTCATPQNRFGGWVDISLDENFDIFFEVNCSGDYNEFYQAKNMVTGEIDYNGNGQPSLVYKGFLNLKDKKVSQPKLYGKSHQHFPIDKINISLDSITSAKRLIKEISIEIE